MQFGKVDKPELVDFTLPSDHTGTKMVLKRGARSTKVPQVYVGCAKWNKTDLKNFYPRGTKDELAYYSKQFNCIELNATFYRLFPKEQFEKWNSKTPDDFRFFPKLTQDISHFGRLKDVEVAIDNYLVNSSGLGKKLGSIFLQMPSNFSPKDFDRLINFVEYWPRDVRLAIELRHTDWFNTEVSHKVYELFEGYGIANNITDTAGRRDLLHMRLTTPWAFIRFTGANHKSDYSRLDDWVDRVEEWTKQGIEDVYFFIHQNMEVESPLLATYFINKLNDRIGTSLKIPESQTQVSLF